MGALTANPTLFVLQATAPTRRRIGANASPWEPCVAMPSAASARHEAPRNNRSAHPLHRPDGPLVVGDGRHPPLANFGTKYVDLVASCFGGSSGIAAADLQARRESANMALHSSAPQWCLGAGPSPRRRRVPTARIGRGDRVEWPPQAAYLRIRLSHHWRRCFDLSPPARAGAPPTSSSCRSRVVSSRVRSRGDQLNRRRDRLIVGRAKCVVGMTQVVRNPGPS
jgi:hypothetical protein